uniref:RNA-directed RNA polymerase n=1 Tax=Chromera velia CCMP2878 TaxID=1169474 RepID=A0A0G4F372_9ALVE|eukprot:Cvel_14927.t1-p1 / transcript=Cvel_14927.t1 / gene=Cvel_14927 / organism=Chromera_velia_CCMP2878 / gene_product=RNA-dependent RNA polymerase 2, putative / transcript_product=RNA-dependent RNA polymerase 2, putative / location=Cvel_scaffold1082:26345-53975(-) / protein_length=2631 / sequence_SO=supercontig / SO=protein_coding / is_pseudo=false
MSVLNDTTSFFRSSAPSTRSGPAADANAETLTNGESYYTDIDGRIIWWKEEAREGSDKDASSIDFDVTEEGRTHTSDTIRLVDLPPHLCTAALIRDAFKWYGVIDEVRIHFKNLENKGDRMKAGSASIRFHSAKAAAVARTAAKRGHVKLAPPGVSARGLVPTVEVDNDRYLQSACIGATHFYIGNNVEADKFEEVLRVPDRDPEYLKDHLKEARAGVKAAWANRRMGGGKEIIRGTIPVVFLFEQKIIRLTFEWKGVTRKMEIPFRHVRGSIGICEFVSEQNKPFAWKEDVQLEDVEDDPECKDDLVLLINLSRAPFMYTAPSVEGVMDTGNAGGTEVADRMDASALDWLRDNDPFDSKAKTYLGKEERDKNLEKHRQMYPGAGASSDPPLEFNRTAWERSWSLAIVCPNRKGVLAKSLERSLRKKERNLMKEESEKEKEKRPSGGFQGLLSSADTSHQQPAAASLNFNMTSAAMKKREEMDEAAEDDEAPMKRGIFRALALLGLLNQKDCLASSHPECREPGSEGKIFRKKRTGKEYRESRGIVYQRLRLFREDFDEKMKRLHEASYKLFRKEVDVWACFQTLQTHGLCYEYHAKELKEVILGEGGWQAAASTQQIAVQSGERRWDKDLVTTALRQMFTRGLVWHAPHKDFLKICHRLRKERDTNPRVVTRVVAAPRYCCKVVHLSISPSKIWVSGPHVEVSNRILRKFEEDALTSFIRVSFVEEDMTQLRPTGDNQTKIIDFIHNILAKGTAIGHCKFEFLSYASSQLRKASCWFVRSHHPRKHINWEGIFAYMGDFSNCVTPGKLAARQGQCFSATRKTAEVLQKDCFDAEDVEVTRDGYAFCFTDGVGYCSRGLAKEIADQLELGVVPSAFQIRWKGCKGMITVLKDFDERPGHKGKVMAVRPSMRKFEVDDDNDACVAVRDWSRFLDYHLNHQIIILMLTQGVGEKVFLDLLDAMLLPIKNALTKRSDAMELIRKSLQRSNPVVTMLCSLLRVGFSVREPFIQECLRVIRRHLTWQLSEKAHIFVEKGANLFGISDETGSLQDGEVYVAVNYPPTHPAYKKFPEPHVITGTVVVAKCPALHPGDLRKFRAVHHDQRSPHLAELKDVIVFPQRGDRDAPNMLSGSDLDGDQYFVCWDERLLPTATNYEAAEFYKPKPKPKAAMPVASRRYEGNTMTDKKKQLTDFFVNYIKYDVLGQIANAHVAASHEPEAYASRVIAKSKKCIALARHHSDAVDAAKTGERPRVRNRDLRIDFWPDFKSNAQKRRLGKVFESQSVLGEIYRRLRHTLDALDDNDSPPQPRVQLMQDRQGRHLKVEGCRIVQLEMGSVAPRLRARFAGFRIKMRELTTRGDGKARKNLLLPKDLGRTVGAWKELVACTWDKCSQVGIRLKTHVKCVQFRVQYVFKDGTRSTKSPPSEPFSFDASLMGEGEEDADDGGPPCLYFHRIGQRHSWDQVEREARTWIGQTFRLDISQEEEETIVERVEVLEPRTGQVREAGSGSCGLDSFYSARVILKESEQADKIVSDVSRERQSSVVKFAQYRSNGETAFTSDVYVNTLSAETAGIVQLQKVPVDPSRKDWKRVCRFKKLPVKVDHLTFCLRYLYKHVRGTCGRMEDLLLKAIYDNETGAMRGYDAFVILESADKADILRLNKDQDWGITLPHQIGRVHMELCPYVGKDLEFAKGALRRPPEGTPDAGEILAHALRNEETIEIRNLPACVTEEELLRSLNAALPERLIELNARLGEPRMTAPPPSPVIPPNRPCRIQEAHRHSEYNTNWIGFVSVPRDLGLKMVLMHTCSLHMKVPKKKGGKSVHYYPCVEMVRPVPDFWRPTVEFTGGPSGSTGGGNWALSLTQSTSGVPTQTLTGQQTASRQGDLRSAQGGAVTGSASIAASVDGRELTDIASDAEALEKDREEREVSAGVFGMRAGDVWTEESSYFPLTADVLKGLDCQASPQMQKIVTIVNAGDPMEGPPRTGWMGVNGVGGMPGSSGKDRSGESRLPKVGVVCEVVERTKEDPSMETEGKTGEDVDVDRLDALSVSMNTEIHRVEEEDGSPSPPASSPKGTPAPSSPSQAAASQEAASASQRRAENPAEAENGVPSPSQDESRDVPHPTEGVSNENGIEGNKEKERKEKTMERILEELDERVRPLVRFLQSQPKESAVLRPFKEEEEGEGVEGNEKEDRLVSSAREFVLKDPELADLYRDEDMLAIEMVLKNMLGEVGKVEEIEEEEDDESESLLISLTSFRYSRNGVETPPPQSVQPNGRENGITDGLSESSSVQLVDPPAGSEPFNSPPNPHNALHANGFHHSGHPDLPPEEDGEDEEEEDEDEKEPDWLWPDTKPPPELPQDLLDQAEDEDDDLADAEDLGSNWYTEAEKGNAVDRDLCHPRWEEELDAVRPLAEQWEENLTFLLRAYGVADEAQLLTGCISKDAEVREGKKEFDVLTQVQGMVELYVNTIREGRYKNKEDQVYVDDETKKIRASAAYIYVYRRSSFAARIRARTADVNGQDRTPAPPRSFPWIIYGDELMAMKSRAREWRAQRNLSGAEDSEDDEERVIRETREVVERAGEQRKEARRMNRGEGGRHRSGKGWDQRIHNEEVSGASSVSASSVSVSGAEGSTQVVDIEG